MCQLGPFLARDPLVQVVQQRILLADADVTARAHAEGQVGEIDDHSTLPGPWNKDQEFTASFFLYFSHTERACERGFGGGEGGERERERERERWWSKRGLS